MNKLLHFFLIVCLLSACEKDDDNSPSTNSGTGNGFPPKKDISLQGTVFGQAFNIQSIVSEYDYFDPAQGKTVADIQFLNTWLYDSIMNCNASTFTGNTPFVHFKVPPATGIYTPDPGSNGTDISLFGAFPAKASVNFESSGYIEVEASDTTDGNGTATVYIYYRSRDELFENTGASMGTFNNLIEGRVVISNCF